MIFFFLETRFLGGYSYQFQVAMGSCHVAVLHPCAIIRRTFDFLHETSLGLSQAFPRETSWIPFSKVLLTLRPPSLGETTHARA